MQKLLLDNYLCNCNCNLPPKIICQIIFFVCNVFADDGITESNLGNASLFT